MEGVIQDFARVGLVSYEAYPGLLTGQVTMAEVVTAVGADPYFDAVEVTWIEDPKARAEAIAAADASSLSVTFAAQPYLQARKLNLSALDEDSRRQAVTICRQAFDQAQTWDSSWFSVLSGPDPGPNSRQRAADQLVRSLTELCRYAESHTRMPVLLEPFDRTPTGSNQFIGPTAEALQILSRVRADKKNCGLLLDLSHLKMLQESPATILESAKGFLSAVHLSNSVADPNHPAFGDRHPTFGTPGSEIAVRDLSDFLSVLFHEGYLGGEKTRLPMLILEVRPLTDQPTSLALESAKAAINEALAAIPIPPA